MRPAIWVSLASVILSAGSALAAPSTAPVSTDVAGLIDSLSDPDSSVRAQATDRLVALGESARPALLQTARTGDPEQRSRAADILRKLPWFLPDDPPPARVLLQRYGQSPDAGRMDVVRQLANHPGGERVLLRLLQEEPSDPVRWAIVACWIRPSVPRVFTRERDTDAQMRALDTNPDDAPVLLIAGAAWLERDRVRALGYLQRAIDIEEARPTSDHGMMRYAFSELIRTALKRGRLDDAAELLRRQVPREAQISAALEDQDRDNVAVACLAALHRYFGPLNKLSSDQTNWGDADAKPNLTGRIASLFGALGAPIPLMISSGIELSAGEHFAAGAFLQRYDLFPASAIELSIALKAAKEQSIELVEAQSCFALASVMAELNEDARAADLLDQGLAMLLRLGFETARPADDIWAEIHWRRARAADAKKDNDSVNASVKNLVQFTPSNTDLTISMINWLKETGRNEQAKTIFDRVYDRSIKELEEANEDDKAGVRNDLAWLCTRTGEKLPEALEMARSAVADRPENSAFLDTLADVLYATGAREEAIRTEEQALKLSPDNDFMIEQLKRFRAGKP